MTETEAATFHADRQAVADLCHRRGLTPVWFGPVTPDGRVLTHLVITGPTHERYATDDDQ